MKTKNIKFFAEHFEKRYGKAELKQELILN
jgi:hypothetical protein